MFTKKYTLIGGFVLLLGLSQSGRAAGLDAGLLFDDFPLVLSPGHRTEALGPLFYSEENETQKTWAFPPLLSHLEDPATDSEELDFCYPVLTYGRYGSEYRWQLFQLLSFSGGQNQAEQRARRFTLFPFYFQQRSENPDQNYTALVPVYGRIKSRLLRDDIFFVMFPLYSRTHRKDVVTDNYIYPFFHLRHGIGLKGWQFWPFTGHQHKEVTTRTNNFGDSELVAGHDTWFVLWPFYSWQLSGVGTENPQRQHALLPVYSVSRSPQRDVTSTLWPFFNHIRDREKKYSEWQTPWPIVDFARGEGKTVSRVLPFYSHAQNTNLESGFFLWPVYKYNRFRSDTAERKRTRLFFFFYSDIVQKNIEAGTSERRIDLYPFFTYRRNFNGNARLQIFAPLEPILPNNRSVERDYSPLWSIWRSEKNPRSGASSQSLLWNLYRHETTAESRKCSLLFGLFQYQSGSAGKRLRLFYIPVIKTKSSPAAGSK